MGLIVLFAGPVMADQQPCSEGVTRMRDDQALAERIANAEPSLREDLRAYVETALDLDSRGQRAACEAVVEAVRTLVSNEHGAEKRRASSQATDTASSMPSDRDGTAGTAPAEAGATQPMNENEPSHEAGEVPIESGAAAGIEGYETTQEFNADAGDDAIGRGLAEQTGESAQPVWKSRDYTEGAKRAEPFETVAGRISSEQIVDADVRSLDGRALGVAEGFLTTHEGITDVIVSYGGFLNIGDREVAVPIDRLRYDRVDGVFYTSVDADWLDDQADWEKERWFSEPNFWLRDP